MCGASLCQARLQVHPWPHIPFCSWWAHLGTHMHEYTTPSHPPQQHTSTHAHACAHIHVHATPAVTLPQASSHTPTHSHPARHLSPFPRTPSPPNLDAPPTQPRRVHTLHALWHTHPCAAVTRAPAHTHIAPGIQVCKAGAVHTDVPMHARSPAPSGSGVDFPACAAPMSLRLLVTPALHPVCALLRHCSTYVFLRPFAHSHLSHSCPRPLKHDQMKAEVARDRGGGRRKCRWWSGKGVLSCHSRLLGVQSPSRALQTSGLLLPGDKQTPQQVAVSTHLGPAGWRDVSGPARLSPAP